MRHKLTADSHVHSKNSFDADSSVVEQLKRVFGISSICPLIISP